MAGKIITLPLRVSFRSARLLTRVAAGTVDHALALAGRTIGAVTPSPPAPQTTAPVPSPPPREVPRPTEAPPPREAPPVRAVSSIRTPRPESAPPAPQAVDFDAPTEREPAHVSEEPELVAEVAEPGAEEGAGAAIHVAEPWNAYGHMSAKDVIARAKSANPAQLAAVRLYEARHRSRQTVLAAVDRQLKLSNGSAPA